MRNCKIYNTSCKLTLIIPTRARLSSKRIRSKCYSRFVVSNAFCFFSFFFRLLRMKSAPRPFARFTACVEFFYYEHKNKERERERKVFQHAPIARRLHRYFRAFGGVRYEFSTCHKRPVNFYFWCEGDTSNKAPWVPSCERKLKLLHSQENINLHHINYMNQECTIETLIRWILCTWVGILGHSLFSLHAFYYYLCMLLNVHFHLTWI